LITSLALLFLRCEAVVLGATEMRSERLFKQLDSVGYALALRRLFPNPDPRAAGPDRTEGDLYARSFYLDTRPEREVKPTSIPMRYTHTPCHIHN
jgi:hypothetical protein